MLFRSGIKIIIPKDALSKKSNIKITEVKDIFIPGVKPFYIAKFEPSGLQFEKEIEIELPFKEGLNIEKLKIYAYNPDSSLVTVIEPDNVDSQKSLVKFKANHFTFFTASDDGVSMDIEMLKIMRGSDNYIGVRLKMLGSDPNLGLKSINILDLNGNVSTVFDDIFNNKFQTETFVEVKLYDKEILPWFQKTEARDKLIVRRNLIIDNNFIISVWDSPFIPLAEKELFDFSVGGPVDTWFSSEPLIFGFDDFEEKVNRSYFVKVEWAYRVFDETLPGNTFIEYHFKNKKHSKKINDMEPINYSKLHSSGKIDKKYLSGGGGEDNNPPNPPTNPNPENKAQNIEVNTTLSWSCTDPDGNKIESYKVYFGSTFPPPFVDGRLVANYDPGQLEYNTTYYWKIIPYDGQDYTNENLIDTWEFTTKNIDSKPIAPTLRFAGFSDSEEYIINWDDESGNELGFKVYRAVNKINTGLTIIGETDMNEEYYFDNDVSGINFYCYKIHVYNAYGGRFSEYAIVPKSPVGIYAQAGESDITIYWNNQNESQAEYFTVWRKENEDGQWTAINTVNAPSTLYQDEDVEEGVDYYYKVESNWGKDNFYLSTRSFPTNEIGPIQISGGGGGDTFTDPRDGQTYNIVTIGSQTWMAENLKYLPSISPSSGGSNTDPYYYVYDYQGNSVSEAKSTDNFNAYGVLYNFPAAIDACPPGWHLPNDDEWKTLEMYLGMSQSEADGTGWRGTDEGKKLKSTTEGSNNGSGTDEVGFSALPGGIRDSFGDFLNLGSNGNWWPATADGSTDAWRRNLNCYYDKVNRFNYDEEGGCSVRCVRD